MSAAANNNGNEDYKPPVPPHRNTGVIVRIPETPRKHRHRPSSGSAGGNHHANNQRHSKQIQHIKAHGKGRVGSSKDNGAEEEEEEFVELVTRDDNRHSKDARAREVKRATIVGNPMFSSFSTNAVASSMNVSSPTVVSSSSSQPNSSPSSSSASSSSSSLCASSSQEQEESVPLDDLNLGMDYNQIMQYFDNLKESNA